MVRRSGVLGRGRGLKGVGEGEGAKGEWVCVFPKGEGGAGLEKRVILHVGWGCRGWGGKKIGCSRKRKGVKRWSRGWLGEEVYLYICIYCIYYICCIDRIE